MNTLFESHRAALIGTVAKTKMPGTPSMLALAMLAVGGALLCQPALAASTELMSISSAGGQADYKTDAEAGISGDGRFVAFASEATNLVPGDTNGVSDVFVRDRLTGTTERISVAVDGSDGDGPSFAPSISADGRFVAFASNAENLVPAGLNGERDIFVRDRQTGTTELVSVDSNEQIGGGTSDSPSISADGRFVAFWSQSYFVAGDVNGSIDIFVRDRLAGTTELASVSTAGVQATSHCYQPSISADGRFVAFETTSGDLVADDTNGYKDIFVHDMQTGATERVNVSSAEAQTYGDSYSAAISADGRFVTFLSHASNLVADDTNSAVDAFVRDRVAGTTELISVDSAGNQANKLTAKAVISPNGRFVAFESTATNLVAGDTNNHSDVFLRDRLNGTTERANLSNTGSQSTSGFSTPSGLSADGRFVAFISESDHLVPADANDRTDLFVRDRGLLPDGNDDLAVDFGGAGLWQFLDNATWQKIHNASPIAVASGDLDGSLKDEAIVSFAGAGLWARYNNATWTKLHNSSPALFRTGDLDGNGTDELVVDFGGAGLWVRANNGGWAKRHNASPQDLAVGDLDGNGQDDVIVDLGGAGLWALYGSTWAKLHNGSPQHIATGDLDGNGRDELIADFGGSGLWARYNNSAWQKLHNGTSQGLAAGDFDGNGQDDLMVDFGAAGVWIRYNDATWVKRHNGSPTRMLATDLDGNGEAEAVLAFDAAGLWVRYNDTNWVKRHAAAAQGFAAGGIN